MESAIHKYIGSKKVGQVFTPVMLVRRMLDWTGYVGTDIIRKHIPIITDVWIHRLQPGDGVYNGFYIFADDDKYLDAIPGLLGRPEFMAFVSMLRIYKSSGYYEFRAKDLEQYLNYAISITDNKNHAD